MAFPLLLNRNDALELASQLELRIVHIARGCYVTDHTPAKLPVNRFFTVLANPNGRLNYIAKDADSPKETLQPGTTYYIPADDPVILKLDQQLEFCSIQFNLNLLSSIDLFSGMTGYQRFPMSGAVAEFAAALADTPRLPVAAAAGKLTWELVEKISYRLDDAQLETLRCFAPWRKLIDHVVSHCNAELKVGELAEFMNLSPSQLSRKFTRSTGQSPKAFLSHMLLKRAMELLNHPEISIKETAAELKFSDEFVFSRFFSSCSGMSPSEYRFRQGTLSRKNLPPGKRTAAARRH